jgi:hypothetical protein
MLINFDELPENSRIWIYQSNRKLSDSEILSIETKIITFLNSWTAHGKNLEAGYEIKYNRFIVFGLNQENASASGCSIDASVNFIQKIEKDFGLDLMDKMNVTYYNGKFIAHKSLIDFKKMAKAKSISKNTIVFNNLVNTKIDYLENWKVPAKDSWHGRFIK